MYLRPPNDFLELINMKINYTSLNNNLEINKRQIQMSIAPKTSKEDNKYKYRIDPIVSVSIAQNHYFFFVLFIFCLLWFLR